MLEVKHDTALVGIGVDEGSSCARMLDVTAKAAASDWVAARRFDFDHIGAEIGELPRRVGRRNIAKLDHPKMTERGFVRNGFCQVFASLRQFF
jgi:hypothetical protein